MNKEIEIRQQRLRKFGTFCTDMMTQGYRAYLEEDWMPRAGKHYIDSLSSGIEVVSYENVIFVRDTYKDK
jgi:hypothetical protein